MAERVGTNRRGAKRGGADKTASPRRVTHTNQERQFIKRVVNKHPAHQTHSSGGVIGFISSVIHKASHTVSTTVHHATTSLSTRIHQAQAKINGLTSFVNKQIQHVIHEVETWANLQIQSLKTWSESQFSAIEKKLVLFYDDHKRLVTFILDVQTLGVFSVVKWVITHRVAILHWIEHLPSELDSLVKRIEKMGEDTFKRVEHSMDDFFTKYLPKHLFGLLYAEEFLDMLGSWIIHLVEAILFDI